MGAFVIAVGSSGCLSILCTAGSRTAGTTSVTSPLLALVRGEAADMARPGIPANPPLPERGEPDNPDPSRLLTASADASLLPRDVAVAPAEK